MYIKQFLLGLLMQACFLHKFISMSISFIVEEILRQHQKIIKKTCLFIMKMKTGLTCL